MTYLIKYLLTALIFLCCLSCGDKNKSNGDEPTPVIPSNPNKPTQSEVTYSFGTKLQSTIYDNNKYTYVVYVGFNIEKALSSDITEYGVVVTSSDGEISAGTSTSSNTYNKKYGGGILLYGITSSDKAYAFGDYVYVTSSKSHISLIVTARWYLHTQDKYQNGSSMSYEFNATTTQGGTGNKDNDDNPGDDNPGANNGEQEKWNEPSTYTIDGVTYKMILVERPGMRSFRIMQTELPVSKDIQIGGVWINKADRNGDGILIKAESATFLKELREKTGCPFRYPRKDEWVFAAKGGVKSKGYTYSGSDDLDKVGWFKENSLNSLHEPLLKAPNELGIYDMSGNYAELCNENSDDIYIVDGPICGGSYKDAANNCKVTSYKEGSITGNVTGTKLKEKNAVDTRYIALRLVYYCNE